MTAPKQEKWAYTHWHELKIHCHCGTIGAVFDFYAGTVKRAPAWWQRHSLEWVLPVIERTPPDVETLHYRQSVVHVEYMAAE